MSSLGAMVACTAVLLGACDPVDNGGTALPILPDETTSTEPPTTDPPSTETSASTLPTKTSTSATIGTPTVRPPGGGGGGAPAPGSPRGCALPAFPTTGCTGVPGGISLATVNGDLKASTPGMVIDRKHITGNLLVAADNVVITNSQIDGRVANDVGSATFSFSITDTTVGSAGGCDLETGIGQDKFTASRVFVRGHGDGFGVTGDNVVIQDSFVYLCGFENAHSDGVQGYHGGNNVVIRHNTIDQRHVPDSGVTAPVFFSDGSKNASVLDNLLMGGSQSIRVHDGGGSSYVVRGNRVVDGAWVYGPVGSSCGAVSSWSDNRLVTIDDKYNITSVGAVLNCTG